MFDEDHPLIVHKDEREMIVQHLQSMLKPKQEQRLNPPGHGKLKKQRRAQRRNRKSGRK